jgi:hypothetical protein
MAVGGPMPEGDAVRIATQVLSALGAAHASGIVHRDVKPANIILDARGDAKLADFGIAKRFDDLTDSLTATGLIVGTPRYLSPEQARGEPISPATDVYAVGVILHEMLAGAPPFADESLLATANRERQPVPRIDAVRPEIAGPVTDTIVRALAPDPTDRFDSADAMADALRAGTAPKPATADGRGAISAVPSGVLPDDAATTMLPLAATQVMPRAAGSNGRSRALVIFGALCLVGIAGVAIAARDDRSGTDFLAATDSSTVGASTEPGVATPATAAATTPAETPTTIVASTVAVTTVAPTTTLPTVPVLVPGFPAPANIDEFLEQLAEDPSVLGPHGVEIERDLRRTLDEKSDRRQADHARKLIGDLERWTDDGSVDSLVAEVLIEFLAPFAGDGPGGDGDDDD